MDRYSYSDGSGNAYILKNKTLRYSPVTPEMSSSGFYSGGDPAEALLPETVIQDIHNLFIKILKTTDQHTEQRAKGTGLIRMSSGEERHQCTLQRSSALKNELETFLKKCLGK